MPTSGFTAPPVGPPDPFVISSYQSLGEGIISAQRGTNFGTWPVANQALFFPIRILTAHTYNGIATGTYAVNYWVSG